MFCWFYILGLLCVFLLLKRQIILSFPANLNVKLQDPFDRAQICNQVMVVQSPCEILFNVKISDLGETGSLSMEKNAFCDVL